MLKSLMTNFNSAQVLEGITGYFEAKLEYQIYFICCFICSESPSKENCFQFLLGFSGICFSAGLDSK